jgi:hypothetical protein
MSIRTTVVCDRCGRSVDVEDSRGLPSDWASMRPFFFRVGSGEEGLEDREVGLLTSGRHACPEFWRLLREAVNSWVEGRG